MIPAKSLALRISCAALMLLLVAPAVSRGADAGTGDKQVVFLVRHAEKVDASGDPELASAGKKRALALAATLRDAGIQQIHSSDYTRTRDTAAPIAAALGLKLNLYDPHDLSRLAESVKAAGGRHLIVGHSDTTGEVVALLGGDPGEPIDDREYDRLYSVTIDSGGVTTVLLHYGERSPPSSPPLPSQ